MKKSELKKIIKEEVKVKKSLKEQISDEQLGEWEDLAYAIDERGLADSLIEGRGNGIEDEYFQRLYNKFNAVYDEIDSYITNKLEELDIEVY